MSFAIAKGDSCRLYSTNQQIKDRYEYVSSVGAAGVTFDATGSIDGGPCLDWGNVAGNLGFKLRFASSGGAGIRFKLPGAPGATGCLLHRYTEDNDTTTHVGFLVTAAMKIAAHKGTSTADTLYGTGTTTLVANRWYYLETAANISATVGWVYARLWDDTGVSTTELSLGSTLNTSSGGSSIAGRVWAGPYLAPGFASGSLKTSDFYVGEPTAFASITTDLLGDVNIIAKLPNGAGTDSNGTIVGSAPTRWESVDEAIPDDDTTAVTLTTSSGGLSCVFQDVTESATIKAAWQVVRIKDTVAGGGGGIFQTYSRLSGVRTNNPTSVAYSSNNYSCRTHVWGGPSNGFGATWTVTQFNNVEFGFEVTNFDALRLTQMAAEVAYPRVATPIEQNIPTHTGQTYPRGGVLI